MNLRNVKLTNCVFLRYDPQNPILAIKSNINTKPLQVALTIDSEKHQIRVNTFLRKSFDWKWINTVNFELQKYDLMAR